MVTTSSRAAATAALNRRSSDSSTPELSESSESASTGGYGMGFMQNASSIYELELFASLGEGPMSFGPVCRGKTIQEELRHCNSAQVEKIIQLKLACETAGLDQKFTDEQIYRVATYKGFSVGKSVRLLKNMDPRFINTTCRQLKDQLETQTLFPLPSLCGVNDIDDFFYMRPSRHCPASTPTSTVIANLVYVMDCLYERRRNYQHKIGFIANMNDWTMAHFSVDYCWQFMQVLQGHTAPGNVDLFLIVNPPAWFDTVWKIMKPMLVPSFRKKSSFHHNKRLEMVVAASCRSV
eukprot:scaffold1221_cov207-Amphora_coffeaeformis.AAC.7